MLCTMVMTTCLLLITSSTLGLQLQPSAWSAARGAHASFISHPRASPIAALAKKTREAPKVIDDFADLGVSQASGLVDALLELGVVAPMEAQLLAWEPLRDSSRDVALIAEAGSGKTLAYLLPLIDKLLAAKDAFAERLFIVVPTHDLVAQVRKVASALCARSALSVAAADARGLPPGQSRAEVVVGTPSHCAKLLCGKKPGMAGSASAATGTEPRRRVRNSSVVQSLY